jgi:predicted transcriptional regulator of viral defense system
MNFQDAIMQYAEQPITKQVLLSMLSGYKRPYDKINELVKQAYLIPVKRGIYLPGNKLNLKKPELFLMANHILGPSYVSLESALAYWGFIPEKVFETSSITIQKSKTFYTVIGRFSYTNTTLPFYAYGIKQIQLSPIQNVLIASVEKAVCDKIIHTQGLVLRSVKQTALFLIDDMRIDKDALKKLNWEEMEQWIGEAPKKNSLKMLIKTLKQL